MIGYKGTKNFQCLKKEYEVGNIYILKKELIICEQGFHFCQKLEDVHKYYPLFNQETVILKIEVLGKVITRRDKSVTNKFKVLEIIPKNKYYLYSDNLTKNSIKIINNDNSWEKTKYDKNGNIIYSKDSAGYWSKTKYDKNNNLIYNEIYIESSNGYYSIA